ncbi:peptidoglycan-binding protein LysM [Acinetobacter sp. HY1485]|uniref:peptidoglycan-binding protein LysM n=1 Tax=Acinetobacter sp. HY1485 TaxID=2970918 RepID=UPI0022B99D6D|nr:peptidoglycan-binding protein LysM [Acinetobacter sp. HY1485]
MGLFDFIKGIGKKNEAKPAQPAVNPSEPTAQEIANQLLAHIQSLGIPVESLSVSYNSTTDTAVVKGQVQTQADKEKIVIAVGNIDHVAQVDDQLTVAQQEQQQEQSQFYTVKSGDTLSKISKEVYGDSNQYNKIFEANTPMLKDANSIFPGQVLRIPQ